MNAQGMNKRGQMQVFLVLFSLIMGIGIVISIYNILSFEIRAKNIMDAAIDAQYFRKDYMIAMLMPVQNITICHKALLNDKCAIYVKTPLYTETNWHGSSPNQYAVRFGYPEVLVEIQDPKANISIKLGVELQNNLATYPAGLATVTEVMVAPEIRASRPEDCWNDVLYRYCKYVCTSPIQITKTRGYNSTYGIFVDKMNVSQFMGDQCLA